MFNVDGLISGLDTEAIVEGALSLQRSRIDRLNLQRQEIVQEQTAFKTIEGQLLALRGSLGNILRSSNNAFDSKIASSSKEEAIEVSASSSATPGTYHLRVTQLAQAHQIKSNGLENESDLVGSGTFSVQVGQRAETIITVDDGTTIEGLVTAINAQSDDVRATIVDDGSSGSPLRLLITSRHSGTDNAISIDNNLTPSGGPTLDFTGPAVQDAQDAQVQIGTGGGAITITNENNQFDSLIPGVTLDLLRADPAEDVVITVTEDTQSVVDAVDGFVNSYNQVVDFIDSNSKYDTESGTAGLFLGNRSAANVLSSMRNALSTVVDGVNENVRTLTSIGISTTSDGKLSLSQTKLQDILTGRVDGVGVDDIRRLFAIDGQSDNPGIEFLLGTNRTSASPKDPATGELIPYEVEITRAAGAAQLDGDTALAASTVISAGSTTFQIEVDRTPITVEIPTGTYDRETLADQIETLINTSPDRAGREINARIENDFLVLESKSFGKSSTLKILAGTANASVGFSEGQATVGNDVAGVFRVELPDGGGTITEQATGNGRTLSSDADNEYTAQLQIRSTLQPSQISPTTDAHLTITRGIGAALDAALGELLNSTTGELSSIQDRFALEIEAIDGNIDRVEARLESRREALLRQFAALEVNLAELQSTGDALTSSLLTI